MSYDVVRKLIKTVGSVLAVAIAILVPAAFGILGYIDMNASTAAEATFHARYIGRMIENGKLELSAESLQETVGSLSATASNARIVIEDEQRRALLEWGTPSKSVSVTAKRPITLAGETIGFVAVEKPITGIYSSVLLLMLLGGALAMLSYLGMTKVPLRALDDVNAQLARHQKSLIEKNEHLDAALTNMVQGVCLYDADQRVIVANKRYAEIYNLSEDLLRPGTSLREILEARVQNKVYDEREARELVELGIAKFRDHVSEVVALQDGRYISILRRPLANGGLITTHEDITARKKADAQIEHLAMHDLLTGLPNRMLFRERLDRATSRVTPHNLLAVHCLDLDRFKAVNDTLGHPMGDALLRVVSQRLQGCIRDCDSVARLGGDEFAILQTNLTEPGQAAALANRVIETLSQPFDIEGHRMVIGVSVGIAIAPFDGEDGTSLLKNADLALYCSKSEGRGHYRYFESEMDARIQARRMLELDLTSALALGQFELHYQPLIDLKSNAVAGMEALLRWKHPERGSVSPAEFIPVTEEMGLIEDIGRWVLNQACLEAAQWPEEISVSVNLSAHQFESGQLAFDVAAALAQSGLKASRLELEITESALMQNTEATLETLTKIRALGVRVAMDDFGTGYSSLSYLHAFPFDKIKIDKCFVQDLSERPDCGHILRAVVGLGASLRMVTTAEGVETQEQLDQLREEGCAQVQGYFFSPPKPAAEIAGLLRRLSNSEAA